ncbi:MAG TPA: HD domain-containing protein, partial [Acidobacteriaceae bacterium]|nr:HD domain-containing protein [Acidobacteriaceae bacterium]
MAISSARSDEPGRAASPTAQGAPSEPVVTDTGMELEAALPVAQPIAASQPNGVSNEGQAASPEPFASTITADHLKGESPEVARRLDEKFDRLLREVHENRPGDDLDIIRRAWVFCLEQHHGQKRASGEPYVVHPLEVGLVLAELKMDSTAIAAGLLHDAVEDTDVTTAEVESRFGDQVAHIVDGVTKLDRIKFANREDQQAENIRKMLLAMVTDVRVVIIKLADRLHNMRTLEHLKPEKRQKIAKETLDIYAPLAHRLGMGKLRGELEDLAFRYTDPFVYEQLEAQVNAIRAEGEVFLG